jgi:hypothetical protein
VVLAQAELLTKPSVDWAGIPNGNPPLARMAGAYSPDHHRKRSR